MWNLRYTYGISLHDSDAGHINVPLELKRLFQINRARKEAKKKWQEILNDKNAKPIRYRNPKLVWIEPLLRHSISHKKH